MRLQSISWGILAATIPFAGTALAQSTQAPEAAPLPALEVTTNKSKPKTQKKSASAPVKKAAKPPAPVASPQPATDPNAGTTNAAEATRNVATELRNSTSGTSTISAQDVDRSSVSRVYDALTSTPNVTPVPPGAFTPPIRGETAGASDLGGGFFYGTTPRMVLFGDNIARVSSYANNSFQSLYDIKSIEVLKGPQYALPGANAFAGAYVINTYDPEFRWGGGAFSEVTYNEYSGANYRVAGFANAPISPEAALRLVAQFEKGNDPVEVLGTPTPPAGVDVDKLNDFDNLNLRGKFLVKPDSIPGLSILVTAEYGNGLDSALNTYVNVKPYSERKRLSTDNRVFDTENWAGGVTATYELNSREQVKSITSHVYDQYESAPRNNSPNVFNDMREERTAQDFVYNFRDVANLTGIVGVGLTDSKRHYDLQSNQFGPASITILHDADIQTQAAYADVAWRFQPRVDLLFGGRIEHLDDERTFNNKIFALRRQYDYSADEVMILPKVGLRYHLNEAETVAVTARKGYNAGGAFTNYQTGEYVEYDTETVWTYEAAYRARALNGRLQFAATAFYNDYQDKQFFVSNPPSPSFYIYNEPDAYSYGVEFEAKMAVNRSVDVTAGLGLLQTEITGITSRSNRNVLGNDFGQDPSFSPSLAIAWRPIDRLELTAKGTYVDDYYSDYNNVKTNIAGDYALFDIGASYTTGGVTARAFINNVTDETAVYTMSNFGPVLMAPRTYGTSLDVKF